MFLCLQEYQSCNTLPCPDLKKTTPWTPWTPVNISDNGGHYEQRFRYTCKARIPDPSLLEVGRQRIEMRYCSSDGSTGCSTDGECIRGKRLMVSFQLSQPLDVPVFLLQMSFCSCGLLSSSLQVSPSFCLAVALSLPFSMSWKSYRSPSSVNSRVYHPVLLAFIRHQGVRCANELPIQSNPISSLRLISSTTLTCTETQTDTHTHKFIYSLAKKQQTAALYP